MIEKLELRAKMSPFAKGGLRGIFSRIVKPWVTAQISPGPSFSKRGNLIHLGRCSFEIACP